MNSKNELPAGARAIMQINRPLIIYLGYLYLYCLNKVNPQTRYC